MGKGRDGILSPRKEAAPSSGAYDPLKNSIEAVERTGAMTFAVPAHRPLKLSLARSKDIGVIKELNMQKKNKNSRRMSIGTRPALSKAMKCKDISLVFRDTQRIMGDFNIEGEYRATLEDLKCRHIDMTSAIRALKSKLNEYENLDMEEEIGNRAGRGDALQSKLNNQNNELSQLEEAAEEKRKQIAEIETQLTKVARDKTEWDDLVREDIDLNSEIAEIERAVEEGLPLLAEKRAQVEDCESVLAAFQSKGGNADDAMDDDDTNEEFMRLKAELASQEECLAAITSAARKHQEAREAVMASDPALLEAAAAMEELRNNLSAAKASSVAHDERAKALTAAIDSAVSHAAAQGTSSFAAALHIIRENAGHMLLKDLKEELCRRVPALGPACSGNVLQAIYQLVANNVIKIDRSTVENTVLCLI